MVEPDPRDENNLNGIPVRAALRTMRIIWFSLVMGQVGFLLILVLLILPSRHAVHPQPILSTVAFIFAAAVIPGSFVARTTIFRRRSADGRLAPATYFTGSIIFWAGCEAVTFFALIVVMLNGNLWPTIIVAAIGLALCALTFPMADKISDGSE